MNKTKTVILLVFFCTTDITSAEDVTLQDVIAKSTAIIVEKIPVRTRVAIVVMETKNENLAAFIIDEITRVLVNNGIEVADRNNLSFVLKKLRLQVSDLTDDKNAVKVGKFLGAKYVIKIPAAERRGILRF